LVPPLASSVPPLPGAPALLAPASAPVPPALPPAPPDVEGEVEIESLPPRPPFGVEEEPVAVVFEADEPAVAVPEVLPVDAFADVVEDGPLDEDAIETPGEACSSAESLSPEQPLVITKRSR